MFELDLKSQVFIATGNYAQQAEINTGFFVFLSGRTTIGNKIEYMLLNTYVHKYSSVKNPH